MLYGYYLIRPPQQLPKGVQFCQRGNQALETGPPHPPWGLGLWVQHLLGLHTFGAGTQAHSQQRILGLNNQLPMRQRHQVPTGLLKFHVSDTNPLIFPSRGTSLTASPSQRIATPTLQPLGPEVLLTTDTCPQDLTFNPLIALLALPSKYIQNPPLPTSACTILPSPLPGLLQWPLLGHPSSVVGPYCLHSNQS